MEKIVWKKELSLGKQKDLKLDRKKKSGKKYENKRTVNWILQFIESKNSLKHKSKLKKQVSIKLNFDKTPFENMVALETNDQKNRHTKIALIISRKSHKEWPT